MVSRGNFFKIYDTNMCVRTHSHLKHIHILTISRTFEICPSRVENLRYNVGPTTTSMDGTRLGSHRRETSLRTSVSTHMFRVVPDRTWESVEDVLQERTESLHRSDGTMDGNGYKKKDRPYEKTRTKYGINSRTESLY